MDFPKLVDIAKDWEKIAKRRRTRKRACKRPVNYTVPGSTSEDNEPNKWESGEETSSTDEPTSSTAEECQSSSSESDEAPDRPMTAEDSANNTPDEWQSPSRDSDETSEIPVTTEEELQEEQPEDYHSVDDLPQFSDDIFMRISERNRKSKANKRMAKKLFTTTGCPNISLGGGKEQLRQAQLKDPSLKTSREKANKHRHPFSWSNELLVREWIPPKQTEAIQQIVLPTQYREDTLKMAHIAPWSGHFGRKRSTERILNLFFWPGVRADVADMCRRCVTCQRTAQGHIRKAPLVPLPIIEKPFSRIAMDMIGPLPATEEGYKYVLTVCDYGTKYPEAFPLKQTSSTDVAEALVHLFARVGFPDEILTDRGSNFCSELSEALYQMLGIRHIRTSAYHPQTDGLVERYNATLKTGLRKYIDRFKGQWDKAIPFLLFAYRGQTQESTGYSPFELLYGRNPRGPLDILKEEWVEPQSKKESVVSFLMQVYDRLEVAREVAKTTQNNYKRSTKQWYDKKARMRSFQVDDLVLVLLPSNSNKLLAKWKGPYPVTEKLSETTYRVRVEDSIRKNRVYHVNMMSRWESPSAVCLHANATEMALPEEEQEIPSWSDPSSTMDAIQINPALTTERREQYLDMLKNHKSLFGDRPGKTDIMDIEIVTGDARPISTAPYRIPHSRVDIVKKEIAEMLRAGIIRVSKSPWAAPMILVPKKDGSLRICIDFRKLNAVTQPDPFPIPHIDDLIAGIAGAKFFTTLDLTKGYWQVPVAENSIAKMAFTTVIGKYEFRVMPFGLVGAPATFQRIMNVIFGDVNEFVAAYMDDVVIFSQTWDDHLVHVNEALKKIADAGLTINAKKCQMAMEQCSYLGHIVGKGQIQPIMAKTIDIQNFLVPRKKKDVRSFLGLTGYYRKFVQDYSTIATPLSDLTKKECPDKVIWTELQQEAFDHLKQAITSQPVLQSPDYSRPFILHTDASDIGLGAILSQVDDTEGDKPIAFFSRKLKPAERNYAAVEHECLAIVDGIEHFQVYLTGVAFQVVTDHSCLQYLDRMKDVGGRLTRWSLRLQPFKFTVSHRPGVKNGNADGLSRQAWDEEPTTVPEGVGGSVEDLPAEEPPQATARPDHERLRYTVNC